MVIYCLKSLKSSSLRLKLSSVLIVSFTCSFHINTPEDHRVLVSGSDVSVSKEITFIHIGDTHYNTRGENFEEQRERHRQTIRIMNKLPGTPYPEEVGGTVGIPMGVFVVGDLTESRQSDFDVFAEDWGLKGGDGLLDFPVYEGAGNHDGQPSTHPNGFVRRAIIERNPSRPHVVSLSDNGLHYSLDYGGVHFVQLNEYAGSDDDERYAGNLDYNRKGQAYGNPSEKSLQFLEKTLEENVGNTGRPVILFQHYGVDGWPLSPWGDDLAWWTDEHAHRLWETIAGYNVIGIMVGHGHNHSVINWNGIPVYQMDAVSGFGVYRIKDNELIRIVRNLQDDTWGEVSEPQSLSNFAGPPKELVQGPYLVYEDNPTEMTVLWRTSIDADTEFRWGHTGFEFELGNKQVGSYDEQYNLYRITLTDLDENERYTYQLRINDQYETGMFYTAPDHNADKVKFLVYGSTAAGGEEHDRICSALYNKIFDDPAYHSLLIHTGNWVPRINSIDHWDEHFFSHNSPKPFPRYIQKRMPVMGAVGHREGDISLFRKLFPYDYESGPWYSFRYGPVHITVMDPYTDYSEGSIQHTWMVNDIKEADAPWKVLVFGSHEPGAEESYLNGSARKVLQSLCEEHGVDLIIGGSNSGYTVEKIGPVNYIGLGKAPSGGDTGSQELYFGTVHIEDGTLSLQIFNDTGEEVPTLELTK